MTLAGLLLGALLLGGGESLRRVWERGPLKVVLEVTPARPRLSDLVTLTVRFETQAGARIRPPSLAPLVRDFAVRDFVEGLPRLEEGREVRVYRYTLEPRRTGPHLLAAVTVPFTTRDGKEHRLTTEALPLEVESVLGKKVPRLEELAPLRGPVGLPASGGGKPWLLGGGAALLLLGAVFLWRRRRRRRAAAAPVRSPEELAHEELQRLLAADYVGRERYGDFYAELTAVVRRYIERTTGVRAPEMTTEEFLREMERRRLFPPPRQRELAAFLAAADLVKFAAQLPRPEDVERSFAAAQAFVGLTRAEAA